METLFLTTSPSILAVRLRHNLEKQDYTTNVEDLAVFSSSFPPSLFSCTSFL
jgi:hypothetical protein